MFENHFQSDDPSTINLQQTQPPPASTCKFQCNAVLTFIILGFVFLFMAMIELITNYQEISYILPLTYDKINSKIVSSTTYVSFKQDDSVAIYLHFKQLTQFSYTNKFDGEDIDNFNDYADSCMNYRLNRQTKKVVSITNATLDPSMYSIPCGKYPSMFLGESIGLVFANNTALSLDFNNLNVFRYNVHNINENIQWASLESTLFQNWMEENVAINTYKFAGKVQGRFQGQIYLQISLNNGFPADIGRMQATLTNNKAIGGNDPAFCWMNFIQSAFMFIFALVVYLYHKTMMQETQNINGASERKIELKSNYESEAGKKLQI